MKKIFAALTFTAVLVYILSIKTGINADAAQENITEVKQAGDTVDSVEETVTVPSCSWDKAGGMHPIPAEPAKVTGVKMLVSGLSPFYPEFNSVRFGWDFDEGADGYEYVIYNYKGKKIFSQITTGYQNVEVDTKKITNDQFMKIKVRGYAEVDGKIKYGKWSDACYFAKCPQNVRFTKRSGGGFGMSWKKTKGAKNYTIYASVKQKSGYRKLGTTSKNSFVVKKVNGKKLRTGKVYFFKIIANKKVGKKTYSSDHTWYFSRIY